MSSGKFKWSLRLATWSALFFVFFAVHAFGQGSVTNGNLTVTGTLMAPGGMLTNGTTVGDTFNSVTVEFPNGNLIGTDLTVFEQNAQGNRIFLTGAGAKLTLNGTSSIGAGSGITGVTGVFANPGAEVNIGGKLILGLSGNNDKGLVAVGSMLTVTSAEVNMGPGSGISNDVLIQATDGAEVHISGSSVSFTESGDHNAVLSADGIETKLLVTNTQFTMSGTNRDVGVAVTGGAEAQINGGSVTLTAGNDHNTGLLANSSSLFVNGTNVSVGTPTNIADNNSVGVNATNGAMVGIIAGSVSVNARNGTNVGVTANNGGQVAMTGGSVLVNTTGSSNIGVLASSPASGLGPTATLNGTTVELNVGPASGNAGVLVTNSGSVSVTDGTLLVNSTGNNSGVQFGGLGQFDAIGGTGTTGGTISMLGGMVEQNSPNGQAILVSGSSPSSGSNLGTFDGTTVMSSGVGILAQGATSELDFLNGASLIPGDPNHLLLKVTGSAIVLLQEENDVHFVGNIDATQANGSVTDTTPVRVNLKFGSSLTGWINQTTLVGAAGIEPADLFPFEHLPSQNANLGVDGSSTWTMTVSSTLNKLTVNSGARIIFGGFMDPPDQPFKTLVMNTLAGTGATFGMSVDLGQIKGDLIAILGEGVSSNQGTHLVEFFSRDQSSDLPVNVALLVVKTNFLGAKFSGAADGGTYKYFLVHGDDPSVTPATPVKTNWYLVRGDQIVTPQVTPPTDPNPETPPPRPPGEFTPGDVGPPPEVIVPTPLSPVYDLTNAANAAIGSYSAIMTMFYADMTTLNQRLGELRLATLETPVPTETYVPGNAKEGKEVAAPPSAPTLFGLDFWIRSFGNGMHINDQVSRAYDQNLGGFQVGADRRFLTHWGDLYVGGFLGYFRASRDFLDGGDGHTDAFSVGAYTTLIHPSGFYADLVIKQTYLWNAFATPTLGEAVGTATTNYSLPTFGGSLEIGKRWDFGKVFIEPQAQLAGAWADSVSYNVSNGLKVNGDSQTSLRVRIGLRLGLHFGCGTMVFEPFAAVSGINEFLGGYTVTTDQTGFQPTLSGASIQVAGGLNAKLSRSASIYAEYDYANGDKFRSPWAVNAGLRWEW